MSAALRHRDFDWVESIPVHEGFNDLATALGETPDHLAYLLCWAAVYRLDKIAPAIAAASVQTGNGAHQPTGISN